MSFLKNKFQGLVYRVAGLLPPRIGLALLSRNTMLLGGMEPEILHLPPIVPRRRVAIDIGANNGETSLAIARHFQRVEAIEANPDMATHIQKALPANVTVHSVAVSDCAGVAELCIPVVKGVKLNGWASLAPQVGEEDLWLRHNVQKRTLDSFGFRDVDLIKIDVEGHEMAVIEGARETIQSCQPWMIIEVWDVSRPAVIAILKSLGYRPVPLQELCGVNGAPNNLVFLPNSVSIPQK